MAGKPESDGEVYDLLSSLATQAIGGGIARQTAFLALYAAYGTYFSEKLNWIDGSDEITALPRKDQDSRYLSTKSLVEFQRLYETQLRLIGDMNKDFFEAQKPSVIDQAIGDLRRSVDATRRNFVQELGWTVLTAVLASIFAAIILGFYNSYSGQDGRHVSSDEVNTAQSSAAEGEDEAINDGADVEAGISEAGDAGAVETM